MPVWLVQKIWIICPLIPKVRNPGQVWIHLFYPESHQMIGIWIGCGVQAGYIPLCQPFPSLLQSLIHPEYFSIGDQKLPCNEFAHPGQGTGESRQIPGRCSDNLNKPATLLAGYDPQSDTARLLVGQQVPSRTLENFANLAPSDPPAGGNWYATIRTFFIGFFPPSQQMIAQACGFHLLGAPEVPGIQYTGICHSFLDSSEVHMLKFPMVHGRKQQMATPDSLVQFSSFVS